MTKHEILEKIIVKAQACKELKMNPKDVDLFCDEISVLATELQEWLRKPNGSRADTEEQLKEDVVPAFQKGAEFGYNKANEWHYVKDGDLPKENEYIMIYSKLADNIAVGKRRCAGKIRKRCVYEWYFATYEGTYCLRDKDVIAWKEIVLPKEIKE